MIGRIIKFYLSDCLPKHLPGSIFSKVLNESENNFIDTTKLLILMINLG